MLEKSVGRVVVEIEEDKEQPIEPIFVKYCRTKVLCLLLLSSSKNDDLSLVSVFVSNSALTTLFVLVLVLYVKSFVYGVFVKNN